MITYRYVTLSATPAPFVYVSLASPDGTASATNVPALVDTGADRTVIPLPVVLNLGVTPNRAVEFGALGNQTAKLDLYSIRLSIQPLAPIDVEVAAHPDEMFVLLGRDVLNHYRVVLDGPNQRLEIG